MYVHSVPGHLRNAPVNLLILEAMSATAGADRTERKLKHYFDKRWEEARGPYCITDAINKR